MGNSPGTGEFPAQMASNAENVSIWWRYHGPSISYNAKNDAWIVVIEYEHLLTNNPSSVRSSLLYNVLLILSNVNIMIGRVCLSRSSLEVKFQYECSVFRGTHQGPIYKERQLSRTAAWRYHMVETRVILLFACSHKEEMAWRNNSMCQIWIGLNVGLYLLRQRKSICPW